MIWQWKKWKAIYWKTVSQFVFIITQKKMKIFLQDTSQKLMLEQYPQESRELGQLFSIPNT